MPMTLMDAKEYDEAGARRRRVRIITIVGTLLVLGFLAYQFRFWPEEHLVDKFFAALQSKNYETAYAIYRADPQWKQHGQEHADYPYNDFYRDWGPGGEWGVIKSYKLYASGECPHGGSGVVVEVIVNDRHDHEQLYVQKKEKTFSPSPCS
jgi:hypothetical protein